MWQIYAMEAMDLARERQREADALRLARAAEAFRLEERRFHGAAAVGRAAAGRVPSAGRRVVAGALRRLGAGAGSLADAACSAATRVEGRAV